jgi:voltage-gated potassium channel
MTRLRRRLVDRFAGSPLLRRMAWHARRVGRSLDRRFFIAMLRGALVFVLIAALLVTLFEKSWTIASLFDALNWAIATILGQGDSSFVVSPAGRAVAWLLILFGVAIFGAVTGALVALVIDFLLKEGQGMGASGYREHVVVAGWNTTARDLIQELRGDDFRTKVVVIADLEKSPAGDGVYYVRGDGSDAEDLERAGIREAAAAIVFPRDGSGDADMHSILTVMAIESIAPHVRTVAEVNDPKHVEHFRRAKVDEVLVTSRLASHLLARSAIYPGLTELVTDIVSGGEGSELYRVGVPDDYLGLSIDEVSARLRRDHRATLVAVNRGARSVVNPPADFRIQPADDLLVIAESLGSLAPLTFDEMAEASAAELEIARQTASA